MIKKAILAVIIIMCSSVSVYSQFTINIDPYSSEPAIEGESAKYLVTYSQLPDPHKLQASVVNGTIIDQNLEPDPKMAGFITVLWDCNPLNGNGDITVTELLTNTSGTLNVFVHTFLNDPTYCNRADPLKQNLLYGQAPEILKVITCSRYCNAEQTSPYRYQWQVGDVAIGVFPQVPLSYSDIIAGTTSETQAKKPEYQPPTYFTDCIKAYRRITIVTDPATGLDQNFYSEPAVISTFGQLNPGTISWQGAFNNGIPVITQTPATGGFCDGYNYIYTWEFSNSNLNWTTIASGVSYPPMQQISGSGYLRRRVDCNTQSLYTNVVHIIVATLNPGTISGGGTYAFNAVPIVSQTAASGGVCNLPDYQYSWERSVNGGAWVSIGTSISYPSNAGIIADCQVRRKVHCVFEDAYTNVISFTMLAYSSPNTENLNYVRVNDIVVPGVQSWLQADAMPTGEKLQTTTYLNAFGHPVQTVVKQGSLKQATTSLDPNSINNYQDLVAINEYDGLERIDKSYLPYATPTSLGFFKSNAHAEQQSFINQKYGEPAGSTYTCTQTSFDGSPLNRVINVKLPGAVWNTSPAYKGISSEYEIYKASENVRIWNIGFNSGDKPIDAGAYPDGNLLKNITKDDKDKLIVEYKDLSGNIILKKVQEKEIGKGLDLSGHLGWLCTYYVYDDFGRLRYTITPKAVAQMLASNLWIIDDAVKKGLCFYQEYDKKGRVIIKHSADGGEVWLVYDNRDRLVLSQDENQRNRFPAKPNQWSVSLYDDNDRPVATGLIDDARNRSAMEAMVTALNSNAQNRQISLYTGSWELITVYNPVAGNFPGTSAQFMITNSLSYYDEYKTSSHPFVQISSNDFAPTNDPYVEASTLSLRIKGVNTVSKLRVLDSKYDNGNLNDEKFLVSTNYFDDKGRLIQGFTDNIKGGNDMSSMQYDFSGKTLCTSGRHYIYGGIFNGLFIITKSDYDLLGRATKLWKLYTKKSSDISNLSKYKKLNELVLDEFGRLRSKQIGEDPANPGSPLEIQDLSYNIQGWLTGINKDYALADGSPANGMSSQWSRRFGMYLGYENADTRFIAPQWSGNITGVIWRSQGDNTPRKYNYEYDNINRFTAARFLQKDNPQAADNTYGTSKADLSVFVTGYDANGNITGMKQTGLVPGINGGVLIDDLQYTYYANSNQLKAVNDLAFGGSNIQNGKQGDFKNFAPSTGIDYDYDKNGNLKNDKNKNIVNNGADGIVSNFLDLPQQIIINGKSKTEYTYDAAGIKLAKKVTQLTAGSAEPITTYYLGGLVYEGQSPSPGANEVLSLQYILNEEGKLRMIDPVAAWSGPSGQVNYLETRGNVEIVNTGTPNKWGVWDYFVKDNLSNTRMVLTEEYHQQQLLCSMEATPSVRKNEEEATFGNNTNNEVANTRYPTTSLPWQPSPYVSKLIYVSPGVQPPTTIGPNTILKVMAGDILNGTAKYYYQSSGQSNNVNNIISNIANSLFGFLQNPGNVSGVIKDNISNNFLSSNGGPLLPFITDNNPPPANTRTPKAFLNYIFFDEQFRYVKDCSGAIPVPQLQGNQNSASGDLQPFSAKATKNGYVYIYLSNESSNVPVYFDDFRVTHTRGPIVEDNAFYSFGLKMQGISAKAALKPQTKYGYQGDNCEQDDETGYDEFALRSYDPQIGRWVEVDPKDIEPGTYNGMNNDPVNEVDPDGGGPRDYIKMIVKGVAHFFWDNSINSIEDFKNSDYVEGVFEYVGKKLPKNFSALEKSGGAILDWGIPGLGIDRQDDLPECTVTTYIHREIPQATSESDGINRYMDQRFDAAMNRTVKVPDEISEAGTPIRTQEQQQLLNYVSAEVAKETDRNLTEKNTGYSFPVLGNLFKTAKRITRGDFSGATTSFGKFAIETATVDLSWIKFLKGGNYLYHYTSGNAAESILANGLKVGNTSGYSFLTNNGTLSPLQAQIELALPINKALPNTILRINVSGLQPAIIRRVTGNMPGFGAGGGTEYLFNQQIPANLIKIKN